MPRTSGRHWLMALLLVAAVAATLRLARPSLESWTHGRLTKQHQRELMSLLEPDAAQLVRRLSSDEQWLAVIVAATADTRQAVAAAARAAILNHLEHWSRLSPAESSPRAAELAALLADQAARLPSEQKLFAQSLAHRLLLWPVEGRTIDTARLIANCQTVLNLPADEPPLLELATAPRTTPPSPPPVTSPTEPATSERIPPPSAITAPQLPLLIDASGPSPPEPRRFTVPPRGTRISDE